jgi:hypothetical protein
LTSRHPLPGHGLQHFELDIIVRRPNVLDLAGALAP